MTRRLAGLTVCGVMTWSALTSAQTLSPVLAREQIVIAGVALQASPEHQTVPRNIATSVTAQVVATGGSSGDASSAIPADAVVYAELRGPAFGAPVTIAAKQGEPLEIQPLAVSGSYVLENIRLVSGGVAFLQATPETVTLDVIDKVLVSQVTTRALTARRFKQKGIFVDQTNFERRQLHRGVRRPGQPADDRFSHRATEAAVGVAAGLAANAQPAAARAPPPCCRRRRRCRSFSRCFRRATSASADSCSKSTTKISIASSRSRRSLASHHSRQHRVPAPVLQRPADGLQRRARRLQPRGPRRDRDGRSPARRRRCGRIGRRPVEDGADGQPAGRTGPHAAELRSPDQTASSAPSTTSARWRPATTATRSSSSRDAKRARTRCRFRFTPCSTGCPSAP